MDTTTTTTEISDEQVIAWMESKRAAAGIKNLALQCRTDIKTFPFTAHLLDASLYGFGSTVDEAIQRLTKQFPDGAERAKLLREEAIAKVAEAVKIELALAGVTVEELKPEAPAHD